MHLEINKISKTFSTGYHKVKALDGISLRVEKGDFVCIIGPSGCGKSTLLNIIAGLEKASDGEVLLNGKIVKGAGTDRAVMFQESALFPWLTVIDNIEFGMKMAGIPKAQRREKALFYLKLVHLSRFKNAFIHELSGGMKQRVALARALTLDAEILLMDEPFSALDSKSRLLLQIELYRIWQSTGKTIIYITHNVEEAVMLADRVVIMTSGPGRVKKEIGIALDRPRHFKDKPVIQKIEEIMRELNDEVDDIDKGKLEQHLEKNSILSPAVDPVGSDI